MLASDQLYTGVNRQLYHFRDGYALVIERHSRGSTFLVVRGDDPLVKSDFYYPTPGDAVRAGKQVLATIFADDKPPAA